MSVANESAAHLIAAVQALGGTIRRDGDMLYLLAPAPLPDNLMARIRAGKLALPRHWTRQWNPSGIFAGLWTISIPRRQSEICC
jgi:hypothetical protein